MWPSIAELVEEIKSGKRSVEDTVREAMERAEEAEDYHALLELNQAALDQAKETDHRISKGETNGDLLGIPFVAKDNFLTKGTKTTAASKMLADFEAPYQSTAIEKLEAEGAILLGKANLDEFAHGSSTENSAFGATKNPKNTDKVPGGSSGGSAAAVAACIVPFALGTDTGGSIRLPASFTGVVGYKPTYGLVSRYGVVAMASSTDVIGPLTANVADSAYVLDVMAGKDPSDSTTIDREDSYKVNGSANLKGLKVGVISEHLSEEVDSNVRQSIETAIDKLESAGAEISYIDLPSNELALAAYYIIVPAEISSNLARYDGVKYGFSDEGAENLLQTYLRSRGQGFGEEPMRRILTGTYVLSSGYQDAYYKQAQKIRTSITQEYEKTFESVDVLLGPTAATTAFDIGEKHDPLSMYMIDAMTIAVNLAGIPAVSLPSAHAGDMPIGLQLQAPQRRDKDLLQIAASVEEVV